VLVEVASNTEQEEGMDRLMAFIEGSEFLDGIVPTSQA
jgi:hypothetical protein